MFHAPNWKIASIYTAATVAAWWTMREVVPEHWFNLVGTILGAISTFVAVMLTSKPEDK